MDFNKLDTKSPQEEGAFCHLRHPKFGHLLWSGPSADSEGKVKDEEDPPEDVEPIGVVVRGMEAPSVKKAAQSINDALNPPKAAAKRPITEEEAGLRFAEVLVVEFRGLEKDGKPAEATKDNIRSFFQMSDDLVQQILAFAKSKPNFFGKASNG